MSSRPDRARRRSLARCHVTLPPTDPGVFLDRFPGEVRGFWGRGDRWVVWAGALAEISVKVEARGGSDGVAVDDRFAEVRGRAAALLGDGAGDVVDDWVGEESRAGSGPGRSRPEPPRFFGGFSFLASAAGTDEWQGFPAARFVLPRVILRGGPDGCVLTVQSFEVGPFDELARLAEHLRTAPTPPTVLVPRASETLAARNGAELAAWEHAVTAVLDGIREGTVEKAVLARIQEVELDREPGVSDLLRFLRKENPQAHVFLFATEGGRALFGAAPEILAELRGGHLQSTAVAGSAARGVDDESDRARAAALLRSVKDRAEHRMTVEEMSQVLSSRLTGMRVADDPRILSLARIQHLESPIEGAVLPGEDVLSLVEALHPTPAVCGRPRDAALELIRSCEPFARGWYAGPVGWFDAGGEGDFVPALRVGVGQGRQWRLFAGAGIVAGSDADLEWEETALKFEPALRALRAGAAVPVDPEGRT